MMGFINDVSASRGMNRYLVIFLLVVSSVIFLQAVHVSSWSNTANADADPGQADIDSPSWYHRFVPAKEKPSKYAFATYLSDNPDEPRYFTATRILAYQLLHCPETRTRQKIPFIVLVGQGVPPYKRERLQKDGAIVIEARPVGADWAFTNVKQWRDVFNKLRLFELTQYERIAFLDGDTIINRPLDDVFLDPAVVEQETFSNATIKEDEGPLPPTYVFAGTPEMQHEHHYPPVSHENGDYMDDNFLNAGFFVFKPSLEVLQFYLTILNIPDRFGAHEPEQGLLNYVHRREGNMPWRKISSKWNIHFPSLDDFEGGVASLHDKYWQPESEKLRSYEESWRWRMEGFFEAIDSVS